MKSPLRPLTKSSRYEDYMRGRDIALERLLQKYLRHVGATVSVLKKKAAQIAVHLVHAGVTHYDFKKNREQFEKQLEPWFNIAAQETDSLLRRLRRTTYALSFAGQSEAIARSTGKAEAWHLSTSDLHGVERRPAPSGGQLSIRTDFLYSRLLRKVVDAFQLSQVQASGENNQETIQDVLARIDRAFPRRITDTKPRPMARLREAGRLFDKPTLNDGQGVSAGTIDPEEWDQILEDYFTEQFPPDSPNRTMYSRVFYTDAPEDQGRYEWEVEADVTQDFVQSVRDGENDAAKMQGINDFQWISIVDSKTDDCCLWRDGLTTSEIERELESDHSGDDCDATVPPAHFNCRCRLAPMTEDLPEPDLTPGLPSFDEWLDAKSRE